MNRHTPKGRWCYKFPFLGKNLLRKHLARPNASLDLLGRLRMHERAQKKRVDGRLQFGKPHQRMRTVIHVGQPMVAHVLQASPTEGNHE